jgi:hypothetical protein
MKSIKNLALLSFLWVLFVSSGTLTHKKPESRSDDIKIASIDVSEHRIEKSNNPTSLFFNPLKYIPK